MKIIIPKKVEEVINQIPRKDVRKKALTIYSIMYNKSKNRADKQKYFPLPSKYLKSISSHYPRYIKLFVDSGIIEWYTNPKDINPSANSDIFNLKKKKYYNKSYGICMSYRFTIDTTIGTEVHLDLENPYKKRWYNILHNTLVSLSYEPKIGRDDYGLRVHHPLNTTYKLALKDRGYVSIDANCSQPSLLYHELKRRGITDENYFYSFENDQDFYSYLMRKLGIKSRVEAKDLFMMWVGGRGYVKDYTIHELFPQASNIIKSIKNRTYKNGNSYLQRIEARIWVDDILQNIPTEHAISVHDCIIIKEDDADKIYKYIKSKYPQMKIKMEAI